VSPNSDPTPLRKPPSRWWLIAPWSLAILAAIGWSIAWLVAAHQLESRLDAAAAPHPGGWQASWRARRVYGYPFRLDVDVDDLKLADPSGWGLAAPSVKAEAYLFAPTNWIVAFPTGLSFARPGDDGAIDVRGRLIRFSLNSWDEHPPRLSLEGEDLTFTTPGLNTKPFALERAADIQFYTRAGPNDQGALLLTVKGGVAAPGSWLAGVTQGQPAAITLDATFSHAGQMHGVSIRDAALRWAHSGGAFDIQQVAAKASSSGFDGRSGRVSVSDYGVMNGQVAGAFHGLDAVPPLDPVVAGSGGTTEVVIYDPGRSSPAPKTPAARRAAAARLIAAYGLTLKVTGVGKAPSTLTIYPGLSVF
jgi:hypothetical protein